MRRPPRCFTQPLAGKLLGQLTVLRLEHEALVALGGDLGEAPEVVGTAQVHAELAVLTW